MGNDIIDALSAAILDMAATAQKIRDTMRRQGIKLIDAPVPLVTGLEHLDRALEDLKDARSELRGEDA